MIVWKGGWERVEWLKLEKKSKNEKLTCQKLKINQTWIEILCCGLEKSRENFRQSQLKDFGGWGPGKIIEEGRILGCWCGYYLFN